MKAELIQSILAIHNADLGSIDTEQHEYEQGIAYLESLSFSELKTLLNSLLNDWTHENQNQPNANSKRAQ